MYSTHVANFCCSCAIGILSLKNQGSQDYVVSFCCVILLQVNATFTFQGNFTHLKNSNDGLKTIELNLADFARDGHEELKITQVHERDIVVAVSITLPQESSAEEMQYLSNALKENPEDILSETFIQAFGIPTVTIVNQCKCSYFKQFCRICNSL